MLLLLLLVLLCVPLLLPLLLIDCEAGGCVAVFGNAGLFILVGVTLVGFAILVGIAIVCDGSPHSILPAVMSFSAACKINNKTIQCVSKKVQHST